MAFHRDLLERQPGAMQSLPARSSPIVCRAVRSMSIQFDARSSTAPESWGIPGLIAILSFARAVFPQRAGRIILRSLLGTPVRTALAAVVFGGFSTVSALADNVVHPGSPTLDRPTLTALGVQFPIAGDDNFNAQVAVQYRVTATTAWLTALPVSRVHPESVQN